MSAILTVSANQSVERISVFDMLKIGIGPSSSHTLGPWRAAQRFLSELKDKQALHQVCKLQISLYGSLALTGRGHGTDVAIILGLSGYDPVDIGLDLVQSVPQKVLGENRIVLSDGHSIPFVSDSDLQFLSNETLDFHSNGLKFQAFRENRESLHHAVYYSVGGGFVVGESDDNSAEKGAPELPYPIKNAGQLAQHCRTEGKKIWQVVLENECVWRQPEDIHNELLGLWSVMESCIYRGCHTGGELPGGLHVSRRAMMIHDRLFGDANYEDIDSWKAQINSMDCSFSATLKWIGCFAMAVNEENADFGRIVTAPTNGAAGVIPAVLMYYLYFSGETTDDDQIARFLLVAGEVGSIFKKGATISAAMGGCQAEIGVSSAMAAAALTEGLGGTIEQSLMAAEIAMEHHLGLTCDPVGGLVQVPCIERNSMGAIKAITAANIALESDPEKARVSLDDVVSTMWETAQNMSDKYKETSLGGLAVRIPIQVSEC